jgi:hypothetical protein
VPHGSIKGLGVEGRKNIMPEWENHDEVWLLKNFIGLLLWNGGSTALENVTSRGWEKKEIVWAIWELGMDGRIHHLEIGMTNSGRDRFYSVCLLDLDVETLTNVLILPPYGHPQHCSEAWQEYGEGRIGKYNLFSKKK